MGLDSLSSCNLIGLSSSLAILLTEDLSADEAAVLAAFLSSLGDNVAIIATKKAIKDSHSS